MPMRVSVTTGPLSEAGMRARPAVAGPLLITADDFGLCPEVDDAICLLHDQGTVLRTSLIVNTDGFDHSVDRLRRRPRLQAGIHLNLTDGRPVLPPTEVPSLVNAQGAFIGGRHYGVLFRILAGRFRLAHIRAEWRAQAARAKQAGIRLSHLNSHGHLHLLPRLHAIVLDLMEEFQIPFVRVLLSVVAVSLKTKRTCNARLVRDMQRRGIPVRYPERVIGLLRRGSVSRSMILEALRHGGNGPSELIVHPSLGPNSYHARWRYDGDRVMRALLAEDVASLVRI